MRKMSNNERFHQQSPEPMGSTIATLFGSSDRSLEADIEAEQAQTIKRLIISNVVIVYGVAMGAHITLNLFWVDPWIYKVLVFYLLHMIAGLILFWAARQRPGVSPFRRITGMAADYGFLGLMLSTQSIILMPLYTVIIWVTLGNGLRYGRPYLTIATGFALFTVIAIGAATYQDKTGLYVTVMVLLMVLAIPHYAVSLADGVETARKEAEAANIAKSRFLAQASHDLRQPIHAIGLFLMSLQQTGLRPTQQRIVDRIDRSLQGVARLFKSLLDLSTLDSGSVQVEPVPVSLADLLSDLVQQNAQLAQRHECDLRLVNVHYVILADRNLLMTMVQNLLSNAFKFASGRSVLIGCRKRGAKVSLQIWDQGDGIDDEHLPRLFEEFYQVKGRGDKDQQGVGLGLTIVSRMAKLMGLTIKVVSSPGNGSCFSIDGMQILPRTTISAVADDLIQPSSPISGMRILLVEDDADILAATTELINGWGCKTTAMVGVPTYLTEEYDLMIIDFDLGNGVTGADCLAAVRYLSGSNTPAIVLTAHDEAWVFEEINDPDALILKKPLRPSELRSAIGAARMKSGDY
jgi:signal transduction histidine kinase